MPKHGESLDIGEKVKIFDKDNKLHTVIAVDREHDSAVLEDGKEIPIDEIRMKKQMTKPK
jgi:hypothetical protein